MNGKQFSSEKRIIRFQIQIIKCSTFQALYLFVIIVK